jgi:RNA polymerase sigma-70 factor (ECF subfamily)
VRTHGGRLLAVARRLLGNEEDARDAVQDAFLNAYRGIGRFEGGSLLSTWLHRITVNVSLMKLRTRRRKPEESLDHLLPAFKENGHFAEQFDTGDESAEQRLARIEEQQAVRAAIDELPDHYRTILLLRDIEGIGTNEVAEQLGVTPNAVKLRLHRARQALRTLVAPRLGRR